VFFKMIRPTLGRETAFDKFTSAEREARRVNLDAEGAPPKL